MTEHDPEIEYSVEMSFTHITQGTEQTWHLAGFCNCPEPELDENILWVSELVQGGESYRHVGRDDLPDDIREMLEAAGFIIDEE